MSNHLQNEVERPIINSPYVEPSKYWKIHQHEPPELKNERRPATYFYTVPTAKQKEGDVSGEEIDIPLVSKIRERVSEWRTLAQRGEGGVSRITMDLLNYWRRAGRAQPLFFAQLEAAETIIFLNEARSDFLQGIDIPLDTSQDESIEMFRRRCCKMATGSGKTTVMAMLAAWSILNKVNDKRDARYSKAVLVVCPNVTIRARLAELNPQRGLASIYRTRDLVPPSMMSQLSQGKVLITNWHAFEPKSGNGAKVVKTGKKVITNEVIHIGKKNDTVRGKRFLTEDEFKRQEILGYITILSRSESKNTITVKVKSTKYIESDRALVDRLLKSEFGGQSNILVFNDEAHHAYRLRNTNTQEGDNVDPDGFFGESDDAKLYEKEATIWVEGLDKVHHHRRINQCIDFSATPYFIQRAGKETNKIYPWTVSNFGLQDAIESGLVKIPQLAVRDSSGADVPGYFNIWEWIKPKLTPAERGGKKSEPKPSAILKHAHTPMAMMGGIWESLRKSWQESDEKRPPVFIIVCKTTKLAKVVFEWLAEDNPPSNISPAGLPSLQNKDGSINTIRVDSKVYEEIASGSKGDEMRWMRITLDTIGKTQWPKDGQGKYIYPDGFEELADKPKERIQFLEYPPGRDVRCIVSVGMLTEGWDCNTVTHIIGLRPFMSQLLCEQVIGRGLRRASYEVNDDGLMNEEIATVLGVPLTTFPVKVSGKGKAPIATNKHHIYAVPSRDKYKITFPRVEGYIQRINKRLICDYDKAAKLYIDGSKIPQEVEMKAGLLDTQGGLSIHGPGVSEKVTLDQYRKLKREQARLFDTVNRMHKIYINKDCGIPANELFRQLYHIVKTYIHNNVEMPNGSDKSDVFMSPYYEKLIEILMQSIKPDEQAGEAPEIPRYELHRSAGSSDEVDFWTKRNPYPVNKSHVNAVVPDTKVLEQTTAYALDNNDIVEAFVKNEQMGFGIPYIYNGEVHEYLPDFIARLSNGVQLILETKGYDELKEIKKSAAMRWVDAVNADNEYGKWAYSMISETDQLKDCISKLTSH